MPKFSIVGLSSSHPFPNYSPAFFRELLHTFHNTTVFYDSAIKSDASYKSKTLLYFFVSEKSEKWKKKTSDQKGRNITNLCHSRSTRSYWENLEPTSGRPYAGALIKKADIFSTSSGHIDMKQQVEMTSEEEVKELRDRVEKSMGHGMWMRFELEGIT